MTKSAVKFENKNQSEGGLISLRFGLQHCRYCEQLNL